MDSVDTSTGITKRCKVCEEIKDILKFPKGRTCKACVKIREQLKTPTHVKRNRVLAHYKELMSMLYNFVKIYERKPRSKADFDCYYIDCKRLLKTIDKGDTESEGT